MNRWTWDLPVYAHYTLFNAIGCDALGMITIGQHTGSASSAGTKSKNDWKNNLNKLANIQL